MYIQAILAYSGCILFVHLSSWSIDEYT